MISSLLHLVGLRLRVYYTLTNFRGGGKAHLPPPLNTPMPIFKDGDPQDIQKYRPISVLPFLSKVFEKIISYYIIEFLDLHNVLYDKQFGFRQCHSTSHAVITLVEKITHALDRGKIVRGVFIDFKKAYDTVSHDILLQKLEAYGIKNNIYELIKSYLSNRKQFVQYSDGKSDVKDVLHGVPYRHPVLYYLC